MVCLVWPPEWCLLVTLDCRVGRIPCWPCPWVVPGTGGLAARWSGSSVGRRPRCVRAHAVSGTPGRAPAAEVSRRCSGAAGCSSGLPLALVRGLACGIWGFTRLRCTCGRLGSCNGLARRCGVGAWVATGCQACFVFIAVDRDGLIVMHGAICNKNVFKDDPPPVATVSDSSCQR